MLFCPPTYNFFCSCLLVCVFVANLKRCLWQMYGRTGPNTVRLLSRVRLPTLLAAPTPSIRRTECLAVAWIPLALRNYREMCSLTVSDGQNAVSRYCSQLLCLIHPLKIWRNHSKIYHHWKRALFSRCDSNITVMR